MELKNFGSIMTFAEQLEVHDQQFLRAAAQHPDCADVGAQLQTFVDDVAKFIKTVQRIRRENVTEMILEAVSGFNTEPYDLRQAFTEDMTMDDVLSAIRRLEQQARDYYEAAAVKLKAQPEVARHLKRLAKKHIKHLSTLDSI
ncbi:MAG: hypothetical protein JRH15_21765 [Deltaproteobacteria bacterium]|nr:hypothetical protein [Deltaproteobacteria bacterium]